MGLVNFMCHIDGCFGSALLDFAVRALILASVMSGRVLYHRVYGLRIPSLAISIESERTIIPDNFGCMSRFFLPFGLLSLGTIVFLLYNHCQLSICPIVGYEFPRRRRCGLGDFILVTRQRYIRRFDHKVSNIK